MRVFNATIVDDNGNIQPGAVVEVRDEDTFALVGLFTVAGVALANPFVVGADAFAQFRVNADYWLWVQATLPTGEVQTWRYVHGFEVPDIIADVATNAAAIAVNTAAIAVNTAAIAVNAADITHLEGEIPNLAWPVGSFYWQPPSAESNTKATAFPTEEEPGELYGGTWEQRYDDEGLFFKTEGDTLSQTDGENNVRTTGLQTDAGQGWQLGGVSGGTTYHGIAYQVNYGTTYGVNAGQSVPVLSTGAVGDARLLTAKDDNTNGTPRTGKETRPRNRLFKLWYRTA